MIFVLLLFMTDIFDSIYNTGITNGYEGTLGRLLRTYLLCLLSFIISLILGVNLLKQLKIKLLQFIIMSVAPAGILVTFTVLLFYH